MRPKSSDFKKQCPELLEEDIDLHLKSLSEEYFNRFELEILTEHLKILSRLTPEKPVEVLFNIKKNGEIACTILSFNYAGVFSLITGIMAGMNYSIEQGEIYTYAKLPDEEKNTKRQSSRNPIFQGITTRKRRKIIDHFSGKLNSDISISIWEKNFKEKIHSIIFQLEQATSEDINQVKPQVNKMVAKYLESLAINLQNILYPVEIEIDNSSSDYTRLKVIAVDTPAFLYALSNALDLRGVSIEYVSINTYKDKVEDLIDFVDHKGQKITDNLWLDQIKFSVLLTKQFTYFLTQAPDSYAALSRFEQLVNEVLRLPQSGKWLEFLSKPQLLKDLARLLGTSDFLWEDMFRQQYETILPMLEPKVKEKKLALPKTEIKKELSLMLKGITDITKASELLNEFKDQQIYLKDLEHIINPKVDFKVLSEYLTELCQEILHQAINISYQFLLKRYGMPQSIAGIKAEYSILGLGKFGGAALGYASDIEFLLVYSDNGKTQGPEIIENSEFFNQLVKQSTKLIRAKREGIFNIDLRLRPYGQDGPLACSLDSFCRYYSPTGQAHAYERLALVRMRKVGGDKELGERLERLRDEFIYNTQSIDIKALRELRIKQFAEKTKGSKLNAKFSPGALVDLEYSVQILQVMYAKNCPALKTPKLHKALLGLAEAKILSQTEFLELNTAYNFLRELINSLRMLRGSAKDLFMPEIDAIEYDHLARRLGYKLKNNLTPRQQLHMEFETKTAAIRTFVERYFGRESLPAPDTGNVVDLILSKNPTPELRNKVLSKLGFKFIERAYLNFKYLADSTTEREQFARLIVLACDILRSKADPDMALNNWEHFVKILPEPEKHYKILLLQPIRLEILLTIFSTSQFLADTLVRKPSFLTWITDPGNLNKLKKSSEHRKTLRELASQSLEHDLWLNILRNYRKREILRIGTRDICLKASLLEITRELSNLADAILQVVLETVCENLGDLGKLNVNEIKNIKKSFCILALGKLGGQELNYSSDIDLLAVYDEKLLTIDKNKLGLIMARIRSDLTRYTSEGYVYRVDFRLRPYGIEGQLVWPITKVIDYYNNHSVLAEIQALLKIRPVAGNLRVGLDFLNNIKTIFMKKRERKKIGEDINDLRNITISQLDLNKEGLIDVKNGEGGIRDIEFLVQGLQLTYISKFEKLLTGNTLEALARLVTLKILSSEEEKIIRQDYIYLRRIEHFLQILEDRQLHTLPVSEEELDILAHKIFGKISQGKKFLDDLEVRFIRLRKFYNKYLLLKKNV